MKDEILHLGFNVDRKGNHASFTVVLISTCSSNYNKGEDNLFLQIGIMYTYYTAIILQKLTSNVDERLALTRHDTNQTVTSAESNIACHRSRNTNQAQ